MTIVNTPTKLKNIYGRSKNMYVNLVNKNWSKDIEKNVL